MQQRVFYLALAAAFVYITYNSFLPADPFGLLAEDVLRAARDNVQNSMQNFLREDDQLPISKVANRLGTRFRRLQASPSDMHQAESSLGNPVRGDPPSADSVQGHLATDTARLDLCPAFSGKRITMIGGQHIYQLHLALLQDRERAEGKSFPCPHHEFCTHHRICLHFEHARSSLPLPRYIKLPTTQELVDTASATVNYIVSDTLLSIQNESSWEYTLPFVDPLTGIRLRETYWLASARRARVIILGRGPLSAPGETYAGNWSFMHNIPDYVNKARIVTSGHLARRDDASPSSLEILNAAVHLTVSRFLPNTFKLLESIRREVHPSRQKRVIWPSSWYRLPGQGVAKTLLLLDPHGSPSGVRRIFRRMFFLQADPRTSENQGRDHGHIVARHLLAFIHADASGKNIREDPWTLLFNAQVYLQNIVLEELLPRYGILFMPLDGVPWAMEHARRGQGHPHLHGYRGRPTEHFDSAIASVDGERMTAIGNKFLKGLGDILGLLE